MTVEQPFAGLILGDLKRMSGEEFEHYLVYLFRRLGYGVELTPYEGDFGADLILTAPDGRRTAVQAKQWKEPVGVEAVQQAIAGAAFYKCRESMVVTTGVFTDPARAMAKQTGTVLWEGREVAEAMDRAEGRQEGGGQQPLGVPKSKARSALPPPTPKPKPEPVICPKCGAPMRLKVNLGEERWVCSWFPQCMGTLGKAGS